MQEFSGPDSQRLVDFYPKKLLDTFKDTVSNSEQNHGEKIMANANKTGPDGWVRLELTEGSTPVAFSPIRAVGLREEALTEKFQGSEKAGSMDRCESPWVARGF